jgi:hypothetical protein
MLLLGLTERGPFGQRRGLGQDADRLSRLDRLVVSVPGDRRPGGGVIVREEAAGYEPAVAVRSGDGALLAGGSARRR